MAVFVPGRDVVFRGDKHLSHRKCLGVNAHFNTIRAAKCERTEQEIFTNNVPFLCQSNSDLTQKHNGGKYLKITAAENETLLH